MSVRRFFAAAALVGVVSTPNCPSLVVARPSHTAWIERSTKKPDAQTKTTKPHNPFRSLKACFGPKFDTPSAVLSNFSGLDKKWDVEFVGVNTYRISNSDIDGLVVIEPPFVGMRLIAKVSGVALLVNISPTGNLSVALGKKGKDDSLIKTCNYVVPNPANKKVANPLTKADLALIIDFFHSAIHATEEFFKSRKDDDHDKNKGPDGTV